MTDTHDAAEFDIAKVIRAIIFDYTAPLAGLPPGASIPPILEPAYRDVQKAIGHVIDTALDDQRKSYEESMAAVGELHLQQIENWEGEVKELERRLEELKDLPAILEEAGKTANGYLENGTAWRKAAGEWKAAAEAADKDTADLVDQLHAMTIENAELRGYQRRVAQFDPISDREHAERADRPVAPIDRGRGRDADGFGYATDTASTSTPWYRRRAQ